MNSLIVSNGGRESSLGSLMAQSSSLHAFMSHENPSLVRYAQESGGRWAVGNTVDPKAISEFAVKNKIDIAMVSADDPLAAGVVDELKKHKIPTVGPTRSGAEIEWNKIYARKLIDKVCPEANPFFRIAKTTEDVDRIFKEVGNMELAIKPTGLTGGKGVKVMGPHLKDLNEAKEYAKGIINESVAGGVVIVEEKIDGIEFTIQAITDGKTIVFPPATYDYPYRFDGDNGPGTGGMGSFCLKESTLPFMTQEHYDEACRIIKKIVKELYDSGRHFNGVLNSGFFISSKGLKVIEFNARFGDPECMNIMTILKSDWIDIMDKIVNQKLSVEDIQFKKEASVVIYLVSPDYSLRKGQVYEFDIDQKKIEAQGCHVFFSSAKRKDKQYETLGTSRAVAIAGTASDLCVAQKKVITCIEEHVSGPLQWRRDIGSSEYIKMISDSFLRITSK